MNILVVRTKPVNIETSNLVLKQGKYQSDFKMFQRKYQNMYRYK